MEKDIIGLEGKYSINTNAVIKSIRFGRILKHTTMPNGYKVIRLCGKFYYVHRLVALTYLDNPNKKKQVNHKDGNKANNALDNLEWMTCRENIHHSYRLGMSDNYGERNGMSKLNKQNVYIIKYLSKYTKLTIRELAYIFDINSATIVSIQHKRTWKSVDFDKINKLIINEL